MRIFITGGTGFIGQHLIQMLLDRGHSLLVLTRSARDNKTTKQQGLTFLSGNLHNCNAFYEPVAEFQPQALIHLAWEGLPDYGLDNSQKNLEYSINIFSLAVKVGCSCILSTGSCWEYTAKSGKITEDDALDNKRIFSAVKSAIRSIGEAIAFENKILFYWLRLFFVYGPGQKQTSLLPHVISSIQQGQKPQIRHPHARHDFVYVADVTRAIIAVIEYQPQNHVYNVGSGYSTSVGEIARIVYDKLKLSHDGIVLQNSSTPAQNFWADLSRIQADIGWQPAYNAKSGISTVVDDRALSKN